MEGKKESHPLMRKSVEELQDFYISENTKTFLDNCSPSYGNFFKNAREGEGEPEFIAHARLDDGTPVRIEGISQTSKDGKKIMPIRIIKIPKDKYDKPAQRVPDYISPETKESFLD